MVSIKILSGHKNRQFAAALAKGTGAKYTDAAGWITISHDEELRIPRDVFQSTFDPANKRRKSGEMRLDRSWRSLTANMNGHLLSLTDEEIVIGDRPKEETGMPMFHFRFASHAHKLRAEEVAKKAGFKTLTAYLRWAIDFANEELEKGG